MDNDILNNIWKTAFRGHRMIFDSLPYAADKQQSQAIGLRSLSSLFVYTMIMRILVDHRSDNK